MGKAKFIVFMLLALIVSLARAELRLEVSGGTSKFHTREDGIWYDSRYETNNELRDHAYRIGLSDSLYKSGKWDLRIRGAGVTLGHFHAENTTPAIDGDVIDFNNCGRMTSKGCAARNTGSGGAMGWTLGPVLEKSFGNFAVAGEVGFAYLRTWYDVQIDRHDCAWTAGCDGTYRKNDATGWNKTWYFGAEVRYKAFFVSGRVYHDVKEQGRGPQGDVGLTGGHVREISVGVDVLRLLEAK